MLELQWIGYVGLSRQSPKSTLSRGRYNKCFDKLLSEHKASTFSYTFCLCLARDNSWAPSASSWFVFSAFESRDRGKTHSHLQPGFQVQLLSMSCSSLPPAANAVPGEHPNTKRSYVQRQKINKWNKKIKNKNGKAIGPKKNEADSKSIQIGPQLSLPYSWEGLSLWIPSIRLFGLGLSPQKAVDRWSRLMQPRRKPPQPIMTMQEFISQAGTPAHQCLLLNTVMSNHHCRCTLFVQLKGKKKWQNHQDHEIFMACFNNSSGSGLCWRAGSFPQTQEKNVKLQSDQECPIVHLAYLLAPWAVWAWKSSCEINLPQISPSNKDLPPFPTTIPTEQCE